MDTARRLALRLYGLHEADRSWLLRQIEAGPRQQLMSLLDEIAELGLLPDPSLLAFASEGIGDAVGAQPAAGARIGTASAATVCLALRDEPAFVRRYLSHAQQWPWLNELDQEQALFLQSGTEMKGVPLRRNLAPSAHRALLQAFAGQIAETDPQALPVTQPVRRNLFERVRRSGEWRR